MSDDQINAAYLALILILPISALAARRLPITDTIKMILAWVAIFAVLFVVVALWQGAMGAGSMLGSAFQ